MNAYPRRWLLKSLVLIGAAIGVQLPGSPLVAGSLEDGLAAFRAERYQDALTLWQEVLANQQALVTGDPGQQIQTLIYLSLAHQALGQWSEAISCLAESFRLLNSSNLPNPLRSRLEAQAHNAEGSLKLATGQPQAALIRWQRATQLYQQAQDAIGALGSQLNQAQALQALGLNQQARRLLATLGPQIEQQPDLDLQITGLRALGSLQRSLGLLREAQQHLQQALDLAPDSDRIRLELANTLQSQARTALEIGDPQLAVLLQQAHQQYEQVNDGPVSGDRRLQIQAQVNRLALHAQVIRQRQQEQQQLQALQDLLNQQSKPREAERVGSDLAQINRQIDSERSQFITKIPAISDFEAIPSGRSRLFLALNIAQLLHTQAVGDPDLWLALARSEARQLNDPYGEAQSLGISGEQQQDPSQLQQALLMAQSLQAPEQIYRWAYQLGRLQQDLGSLRRAFEEVQALRGDLATLSRDVQFSFRDSIEPIYRELVALLLKDPHPAALAEALQVIEALQLAELDNFFRDSCLDVDPISPARQDPQMMLTRQRAQIDRLDPQAALIYPMILPEQLAVIALLPKGSVVLKTVAIPQPQVEAVLQDLRQSLPRQITEGYRSSAAQVYDWLIRPLEPDLAQTQAQTLVFVLDSLFRNVPLAALQDRQTGEFLLQKPYALAAVPGLGLINTDPRGSPALVALKGGLSQAREFQGLRFSSLAGVTEEIARIGDVVEGIQLLDQQFTLADLRQQIQSESLSVIHLATHGRFSSVAEQTFLLTADGALTIPDLQDLLGGIPTGVDLLTLSACQTAAGDNRAALGLAGIAVRAGARSTLASLWSVSDVSTTQLMAGFYRNLSQSPVISKAEALRQAQLDLLQNGSYAHPFFWSPFILLGNWA